MKRKRPQEYLPVQFANAMIPNPESTLYDDVGGCQDHCMHHKKLMEQYGLSSSDEDCRNLARTLFIVRDWMRTKQSYKIAKELADDLFAMDDLTFPANSLRLPYRTIFMDFSDLGLPAAGTQVEGKDYIIYGVMMTLGDVMYYGEPGAMWGFVTILADKNGISEETDICYGGIAFDYNTADDGQTLKSQIDILTKDFTGPKDSLIKAMLFAAYLSSEQPDIEENEQQKSFYRPMAQQKKPLKTSSVRKWDVGIRYATEVKRYHEDSVHSAGTGNGTAKRPHIRKAHWHVYRYGKGRIQKKVLWIPPIEVNCKTKPELPVVVRKVSKPKEEQNELEYTSEN